MVLVNLKNWVSFKLNLILNDKCDQLKIIKCNFELINIVMNVTLM